MKCCIWGTGMLGQSIKDKIDRMEYDIVAYTDSFSNMLGWCISGIPILHYELTIEKYLRGEIDIYIIAINDVNACRDVVQQLINKGVDNILVVSSCTNGTDEREYELINYNEIKPNLNYLETHIYEQCNLNCRGCSHFANIVDENETSISPDKFEEELTRLSEIFNNIITLRLMGGEPLLNPQLIQYIVIARRIFPDSNIRIVTNGLLIPNLDEKILTTIYDNQIGFDISLYPPTEMVINKIIKRLQDNNIQYVCSKKIDYFYKIYDNKISGNNEKKYERCIGKNCRFLANGYLYRCTSESLVQRLNKKYDLHINEEHLNCTLDSGHNRIEQTHFMDSIL